MAQKDGDWRQTVVFGVVFLAIAALSVWVQYKTSEEMSTGSMSARVKHFLRQGNLRRQIEQEYRRMVNETIYEAYEIVTGAQED